MEAHVIDFNNNVAGQSISAKPENTNCEKNLKEMIQYGKPGEEEQSSIHLTMLAL